MIIVPPQESDTLFPNKAVYDMNATAYYDFVNQTMTQAGWDESASSEIFDLYLNDLHETTELAFQQWMTDISFFCGTVQVIM